MDVVKIEDEELPEEGSAATQQLPLESEVELQESSEDSASDEGSGSDSDCGPPPPKCYRHETKGALAGRFAAYKVSRLVDYKDSLVDPGGTKEAKMLSCGRALNGNYVEISLFDSVAMCRRCRINAVKDGILPQSG